MPEKGLDLYFSIDSTQFETAMKQVNKLMQILSNDTKQASKDIKELAFIIKNNHNTPIGYIGLTINNEYGLDLRPYQRMPANELRDVLDFMDNEIPKKK